MFGIDGATTGLEISEHLEGSLEAPFTGVIDKGIDIGPRAGFQDLGDVFDVDLRECSGRVDTNFSGVFALGFSADLFQKLFASEKALDSIAAKADAMVMDQMGLDHLSAPVVTPAIAPFSTEHFNWAIFRVARGSVEDGRQQNSGFCGYFKGHSKEV